MKQNNINKHEIIKKVFPIIEKAVEETNLILLEVDFIQEFGKWHLQVFVYRTDAPITHEDCEKVTRTLAEILDELIPIPYYLEVSSPGTERKLKSSKEYIIFKENRVKIKLKKPLEGDLKVFCGVIKDYSEEKGLLIEKEKTNEILQIEEDNISQIKLEPDYKF
jgi:ribosome maturation factor RimP